MPLELVANMEPDLVGIGYAVFQESVPYASNS